eukprot:1184415-Prorocentrum_minimum.AAC.4
MVADRTPFLLQRASAGSSVSETFENFGNPTFGNPNLGNPKYGSPNYGSPNFEHSRASGPLQRTRRRQNCFRDSVSQTACALCLGSMISLYSFVNGSACASNVRLCQ